MTKKKKILRIVLTLLALIALGGLVIGVLYAFNIRVFDNDGFGVLQEKLDGAWWSIPLYLLLFVLITSLTSFLPFTSMGMIMLGVGLFHDRYGLFVTVIITLTGVMLTSMFLYAIGRFGGHKLGNFLLGEEDIEKATKLLETKGQVYLPLMLMFPMFPDDALCFASGVLKMKWWYFTIVALVFRGIGVFTICYLQGSLFGIIQSELGENVIMWVLFITAVVFWVLVILFLANKLDKYLEKKRERKEKENND